jgi:hypothetical protein
VGLSTLSGFVTRRIVVAFPHLLSSSRIIMNASAPTIPVPAVIGPADLQLPPTEPIDIPELMRTPSAI